MENIGLNELRERYLNFFKGKGHIILPSFPLVPLNDASLLLINSGMAPMKPYFTGAEEPPSKRVTTCQKCIRTPDIEVVGRTARHGTFFEMLGNFSFGDYFKEEAISWAWEFVVEDLKLPVDKIWVSVYEEDEESVEIWNKKVGVSIDRIVRMGKEDNFWEIGVGPCGPCSELYFDRGEENGCGKEDCKVGCECDRFVEFWNLVFTQFNRDEEGNYTRLANPNIDTGMGLERIACIMQNVKNLFEVDTIRNVLDYVCKKANLEYGKSKDTDISIRVITDHIRSTTMLISDGVIPSNEGRGYVLRRLLRRAARHGKLLGIDGEFLFDVARVVINESKKAYPELDSKAEYIQKVIKIEEENFEKTIDKGLIILSEFINETKSKNKDVLSGKMVFKLHDTYGFPLDLTREIAQENGLKIDEKEFMNEMEEQREKARNAQKSKDSLGWDEDVYLTLDKNLKTEFVGYNEMECDANVLYIIKDNVIVESAKENDEVSIILDRTPFYAESGGQVGDVGVIKSKDGLAEVLDCKKTPDGKHMHVAVVKSGNINTQMQVKAMIDVEIRENIAKNHTVTHLLHEALRKVLGEHVNQAGSLVEKDRLRFDFTHFSSMTIEELKEVENLVNKKIFENIPVSCEEMSIGKAKEQGAKALFGEKYGETVRVVTVDGYSIELCGGTHIKTTAEAGLIKILGESGIAAGVRRIEVVTGKKALEYYIEKEMMLNQASAVLKSKPEDIVKRAENLNNEIKTLSKELEQLKSKIVSNSLDDILSNVEIVKDVKVARASLEELDSEALRNTGDTLKNKIGSGVVILASTHNEKVNLLVTSTKDVIEKGIHSGNLIKGIAKILGGGGGGRPDMAQAGGKDISKIEEALNYSIELVKEQIK